MAADPDPVVDVLSGDPVIREAKRRWKRVAEQEAEARARFIDDIKFRHADEENGYQWPNGIRQVRDSDSRPCLTMNVVRQHNLMISNEMRKNKSSVKFVGLGNGATQESANVVKDIMRRIEYTSRAQSAYTLARNFQIDGGIGYWRLATGYVDNDTFDQDIQILPILDPLTVFLDCDIQQFDGSDANFGLIIDSVPRDDFDEAYPKYKGLGTQAPLGMGVTPDDWINDDKVKVCEYFRRVPKGDRLVSFMHEGSRKTIRKSRMHESWNDLLADPQTMIREVEDLEVEWFLIVGEKVIDRTVWPGRYIPLIRCVGEETRIDGRLDRKGHTRSMKGAQRMFNYNASAQVEHVALQGKTPWKGSQDAIDELETVWNSANNSNVSFLPFKHKDENGEPIPAEALPSRVEPPTSAPAYKEGMDTAFNHMMMTSGQFQNEMGMAGTERTGAAVQKRQDQSATSTYHFQDNYELALQYTGRQVLDLIPKIYDTRRVLQMMAEDGVDYELEINPASRQAYFAQRAHDNSVVKRVFNPAMGKYDVAANVGPEYGTKREDTKDALTLILTQAPGLSGIIGDLLLSSMDFDKAQEAAMRLKRMVPPQALGEGPTQQEQQLQAQVQQLTALLAKAMQQTGKDKLRLAGKEELRDIEVYDAETKRMAALKDMLPTDPQGLRQIIGELVHEAMQTSLVPILSANAEGVEQTEGAKPPGPNPNPPSNHAPGEAHEVPGAERAPDGEWYLADPTRKGRYLHIAPLAQERARPGVVSNG